MNQYATLEAENLVISDNSGEDGGGVYLNQMSELDLTSTLLQ
jgi:hypothetical protein